MSLELLTILEEKIQTALETMELLNLELEEEKQNNESLQEENKQLQAERQAWHDKVVGLVDLMKEDKAVNADS
ncbi:MAG: cell division protein ZapB [Oleispira sp.]|jgi:cell division protein ZapB